MQTELSPGQKSALAKAFLDILDGRSTNIAELARTSGYSRRYIYVTRGSVESGVIRDTHVRTMQCVVTAHLKREPADVGAE